MSLIRHTLHTPAASASSSPQALRRLGLRARYLNLLIGAAIGSALLSGCDSPSKTSPEPPLCAPAPDGEPISPELLAFLSRARSAHHLADQLEEDAPAQAITALEKIIKGPAPSSPSPAAEVKEVLADTYARLANLNSKLGNYTAALSQVELGLGHAQDVSYFRGHLFEVRGVIEERQSKLLASEGQTQAAEDAKNRALSAFEAAMDIQEAVINKNLPEPTQ